MEMFIIFTLLIWAIIATCFLIAIWMESDGIEANLDFYRKQYSNLIRDLEGKPSNRPIIYDSLKKFL